MIAHRANGDSDKIELEKYVSYENILKYLYAQLDKSKLQACHLSLRMKLSDGAKEEWDKLIEISPIFIGKNFPKGRI